MKKFLSLCLALVMVFALFCVTASAEEPTGKVMLYSSMQEDQLMAVEKAFEAKYPGIDMEYYYAGGGKVIAAGKLGKLKTVFQMASTIALLLLVPVAGAPWWGQFGVVLANVLMYIAVLLTVISGTEYIVKNFACIQNM